MKSAPPKTRAAKAAAAAAAKKPKLTGITSDAMRGIAAFVGGNMESILQFSKASRLVSGAIKDWKCTKCETDIFVLMPAAKKAKKKKKNGKVKKDEPPIALEFATAMSPFHCGACEKHHCGNCHRYLCYGCHKVECCACYLDHLQACVFCDLGRLPGYCKKCQGPNDKECQLCEFLFVSTMAKNVMCVD